MSKKQNHHTATQQTEYKEPWYNSWPGIVAISAAIAAAVVAAKPIRNIVSNQLSCPHELKKRLDADFAKGREEKRQKVLKNTFSVTVTNGSHTVTNLTAEFRSNGFGFKTNISTQPILETWRICKDCGEVVDREPDYQWHTVWR